jgi:hypothetical protein
MSRDQELFEDEEKSWGDVQGRHSGIPPDEMDNGMESNASPDDDVIELVDVVREGDSLRDTELDELSLQSEQEEGTEKGEGSFGSEDEDLDEFSLPLDETDEGDLASGLDEQNDVPHDDFLSPDFDFEGPEELAEPALENLPGMSDEVLDEMPEEDLDEVLTDLDDEVEGQPPPVGSTEGEETLSVSQERLEIIIGGMVTEVVERVVRETMAEVAERVIKEAIESLKQSLDPTPE